MTHPRPSSVRQRQQPPSLRRSQQQRRHLARALHRKSQIFNGIHFVAILAEPSSRHFSFDFFYLSDILIGR